MGGGLYLKNPHGFFEEEVVQKTMFVHTGGEGSKMSKNLSTWFMDPSVFYILVIFLSNRKSQCIAAVAQP